MSSERSRAEIEQTLQRYGAESFMYGTDRQKAVIMFDAHGRRIRFVLPMPDPSSSDFTLTPGKRLRRSADQAYAAWEQACRQRWRALALVIKAKLEAVETGITTFEDEFLAHTMLPNGSTVGEWAGPQLEKAYAAGAMPALLPGGAS